MSVAAVTGNISAVSVLTLTFDVASVGAATTVEQTFTVPGVRPGDIVAVNKPSHSTGLGIGSVRASAADTIAITFINVTAGAIDPAAEAYRVLVIRPEAPANAPTSFMP